MRATILSILSVAASAAAQNQLLTLPTPPTGSASNNIPFSAGIGRYQQWYSAADVTMGLGSLSGPLRFLQVDFLAGPGLQTVTTLDLQVAMAHGPALGIIGIFDSNYITPPVTVMPRRMVNLTTGPAGSPVIMLPFNNLFTWNGTDAVVIDVKVFGNGRGNQPFPYEFQSTVSAFGRTDRAYAIGNANAQFASSVQAGWGLLTRFTVRPGAMLPFGTGCPGDGGFVPVGTVAPLASPGVVWTHQLSQAASQRLAMWVIGDSRTFWGQTPLPMDLGPGIGGWGCFLLTNPLLNLFTTTVGGGPGAGSVSLPILLPPTTGYIGASFYTQWFVGDPLSANGVLSASAGLWTVVAPVGG